MTKEDVGAVQFTVGTPGWDEVLKPRLERERVGAAVALSRTLTERSEPKFSDDFLRGYVRGLSLALEAPAAMVREFERTDDPSEGIPADKPAVGSPYTDTEST